MPPTLLVVTSGKKTWKLFAKQFQPNLIRNQRDNDSFSLVNI